MSNALKKNTTRAKQRVKKKRSVGSTRSKKRKSVSRTTVKRKRSARVGNVEGGGSAAQMTSMLKKQLKEQLGWMLVSIEQAKTKTEKRKLRLRAADIRKKLRALS